MIDSSKLMNRKKDNQSSSLRQTKRLFRLTLFFKGLLMTRRKKVLKKEMKSL